MEDWEKRFSELEAEVDAEFDQKNKKNKEAEEIVDAPPPKEEEAVKKKKKAQVDDDDDDNLFDDVAKKVATKAIQKTAEKSLAKLGTNKAIIYSVATILALIFVWKNLLFLGFCGAIVGALYYFLEVRGKDDNDEDETAGEIEEDDD